MYDSNETQDDRIPGRRLTARDESRGCASGKREYQVIEEALRAYLGHQLLERIGERSKLKEDAALDLAYRELHQSRRS